jgi:pimeloyl-ACP methyl ester carboxylesterase
MAGFLLIHGAMHGGWCFDAVAEILRGKGHAVAAPDLPGMGGDEETLRGVTLGGWTEFALDQLRALRRRIGGQPLVLAGHSRGGINISAAAEADPSAMDALVYICALMVPNGMSGHSLREILPRDAELEKLIAAQPQGASFSFSTETALQLFAHRSPPDLAEAAMRRLVAEPMAPLATELHLTEERWGSVPRTYVECLHDRTITIAQQRRIVELSPGTQVVTLDSDHSPFLCAPEALAEALLAAAERR